MLAELVDLADAVERTMAWVADRLSRPQVEDLTGTAARLSLQGDSPIVTNLTDRQCACSVI